MRGFSIRTAVALALIGLVCIAAALAKPAPASAAANPIQIENAKPGTASWQLAGGTASTRIQGYASEISLQPSDVLHLHVSTIPAAQYRVEIYRLGWYHGAGGRLIACLPSCTGAEAGAQQAVPAPDPTTGILDAGWPVTDTVAVGTNWTSGYFLAKLVLTSGPAIGIGSFVPFVVRAAPGDHSAIRVQASVNTWQAYNNWGGKSLYTFNSTGPVVPPSQTVAAAQVSFNRPFGTDINAGPYDWEYQLVRYLERQGYDVSYQTDVDTDLNPASLLGHRLDVVSGHDEYWSKTMRDAWEAARGAGVNLAFIGGNIGYWQARYASSDRTLIEYRSATLDTGTSNPALKTVEFRNLTPPRPECTLLGVGYPGGLMKAGDPPRSFAVTAAGIANAWFRGTGFSVGSTIFDSVGYEWDTYQPACALPPVQVLLHYTGSPMNADAVTYKASSGARVFSDGTMQLSWALDDFGHVPHLDPRVQRLFANMLDDLGATPAPIAPTGLPTQLSPLPGAVTGSPVVFRWSAPQTGLQSYQLVVDANVVATVGVATCAGGSCTSTLALPAGEHSWRVDATDALGNLIVGRPATFTVDVTPPTAFGLRAPRANAVLWTPRPKLSWTRSSDPVAGLAAYVVSVDGKPVAATTATSYTLRRDLADGRHSWGVLAVDRVGNQRAAGARTFRIESVRLVKHSRRYELRNGFALIVYCAHRCTARLGARLGRKGPTLTVVHGPGGPGIVKMSIPLTAAFRRKLAGAHTATLSISVRTRSGHTTRTVRFALRW